MYIPVFEQYAEKNRNQDKSQKTANPDDEVTW